MNRGDPQNGWDTDQFPNDIREITQALYTILQGGGFVTGGNNFDAKIRRQSIDAEDLFIAHIGGIDVLARSLLNAVALIEDGGLARAVENRYAGWNTAQAQSMLAPSATLADIADGAVRDAIDPQPHSGKQELLENTITRFI
jgi:xylose isomerase